MMAEVTQEDREAAASGYYAWCSGNPVIPNRILGGNADDHSMVQAFARHAATERAMERAAIVGLLRDMVKWYDANDDGWSGYDRIAQGYREAIEAIEAGEHLSEAIARGE